MKNYFCGVGMGEGVEKKRLLDQKGKRSALSSLKNARVLHIWSTNIDVGIS